MNYRVDQIQGESLDVDDACLRLLATETSSQQIDGLSTRNSGHRAVDNTFSLLLCHFALLLFVKYK